MTLQPPENFDFPLPPYPIQDEFMRNLYRTIQNEKLGIFESPTGTGKSLSIICGALKWLKDYNEYERNKYVIEIELLEDEKAELNSDQDWIKSQSETIELQTKINQLKIEENKINEFDKKIQKLFDNKKKRVEEKVYEVVVESEKEERIEDDDILLEDSSGIILDDDLEKEDKYKPIQIIICSRTHSQLAQLVGEIKKSPFKNTRVVTLASRQNYCVNPDVQKLKNVTLINEKCLDMQNKPSSVKRDPEGKIVKRQKHCQCPYNKQQNIEELSNFALAEVQDIEELVTQAKQLKACPYYASRKTVQDAEIILVPYNNLLHRHTRNASGISLKNNIVIIDEAHNLLEAVAQMYSSELTLLQLEETQQRLKAYQQKFSTRFSSHNLLSIKQLLFITTKLITLLKNDENCESKTFTVQSFVLTAEIDCFNTYNLIKFCNDSKIAQKLHSYSKKYPLELIQKEKPKEKDRRSGVQQFLAQIESGNKINLTHDESEPNLQDERVVKLGGNPFLSLISFLECLQYSYEDGRIILYKNQDQKLCKLKFLVLNPAMQFVDVIKEARSVIFAGGTMKPIPEFKNQLHQASGIPLDQIVEFSCDHIIPKENILPLIVTKGMKQENLLFNYENRFKMGVVLKEILPEVSKRIIGGIVVFFPSYKYEEWVCKQLEDVKFDRPLFREPKDSSAVDGVLDAYSKAIRKSNSVGAILFSVVGGKLSEGLNFSDDLGRCVIVVGLPYANIKSPELQEKMSYLQVKEGTGASQRFYESLCMKSVNQCIGRAVRHKNDYACVLLLDMRYDRKTTKDDLPDWIKRSLQTCSNTHQALNLIEKFFVNKKKDNRE